MVFSGVQARRVIGKSILSAALLIGFGILFNRPVSASSLTPAQAAGLNLGADANYALIDLGAGTTIHWNSGPVNGNVLFGNHVTVQLSGGNNGGVGSGDFVYTDGTANISGNLQNQPTIMTVPTSTTAADLTTAQNVSNYASSLAATQNVGSTLTGATTITGDGGLNVIDLTSINNAPLTLVGNANDIFIFNVTGSIQTNVAMTLSGVLPSNILFNLTGTGTVFQTSGGDTSYGTYLATDGGEFQFSNLHLTGELINTAGGIAMVSGAQIQTFAPFTPPSSTPEPASLSLMLGGGFLLVGMVRRRKKSAAGLP